MDLTNQTKKLQEFIKKNANPEKQKTKKIKEIYQELIDCLTDHNHLYYIKSNPIISDYEYDILFNYLKLIEEYFPKIISSNSPTQGLIGQIQEGFQKAEHKIPLLSLENSYNSEDLIERDKKIQKILKDKKIKYSFIIQPKFDGISIEIIYKNGYLSKAITRGDGIIGENVTQNTKTIKNLPKKIENKSKLILKGEIVLPKSELDKINKIRKKNNKSIFSNTRNAASGSIKLLDTKKVSKRNLLCYIYDILYSENKDINLENLTNFSMPIFDLKNYFKTNYKSINQIIKICEDKKIETKLKNDDIEFDGLVIKIKEKNIRNILGQTAHHPRRAIAYKYPPTQISTQIKSVDFQVGRTGIITPVANLETVNLSGAKISRASLHNYDFIKNKDIKENDWVRIQRSGEVIPHITGIIKEKRKNNKTKTIKFPNKCPICNKKISQIDIHFYCTNIECPAQIKEKIIRFVSKNCMNIEGIGDSIIDILVEQKITKNFADLYNLLEPKLQITLKRYPGFGEKKVNEITKQLEDSKKKPLRRLINALGIPSIGKKTSQEISNHIKTINKNSNLNYLINFFQNENELKSIYGIGNKIISGIQDYISQNKQILKKLEKIGLNFDCSKYINNINIKGSFSITGTFQTNREKIIYTMEKNGYKFDENLNKKTNFILIGKNPGTKKQKAIELGIKTYQNTDDIKKKFPFIQKLFEQNNTEKPKMQSLF